MSDSFREREMFWELEPQASVSTVFSSSPKLSRSKTHVLSEYIT